MDPISAKFFIKPIDNNDKVNSLSLGDAKYNVLKIFLKNNALDFHNNNIAKTYVLVDEQSPPRVWAYITLMCSEITLSENQRPTESARARKYDAFSAIKLARLAVDKKLQGSGLGKKLVYYAIALIKDQIMPYVGCRFFIVDSKPNAIKFYQDVGFEILDSEDNKQGNTTLLFMDMQKIGN